MKKCLSLILALCMLLVSACGVLAQGAFTPGAYSAAATGNNGEIKLTVTVSDSAIESIVIDKSSETVGLGDVAAQNVIASILDTQSLAVDAVTGATNTSKAVLSAVTDCLTQASADIAALSVAKENETTVEAKEYTNNLVIVGAGGAGLIAAITAMENGESDVLVLEKMSFGGGATLLSEAYINGGGSRFQAEAGYTDDPQTIYNDLFIGGKETNQTDLLTMYANNIGASFDWLMESVKPTLTTASPRSSAEHTNPRIMIVEGGGSAYYKKLLDRFTELGGTILYNTKATELIVADGRVTGVRAVGANGEDVLCNAKVTLMATGGFGASPELRPKGLEGVVFYGASSSTGDGILMGEAIGAQTVMMDTIKIYPNGILFDPNAGLNADGALNRNGISCTVGCSTAFGQSGAMIVNLNGERYINEVGGLVALKEAQLAQEDMRAFLIMDQRGYDAWYSYTKTVLTEETAEAWFAHNGDPIFIRNTDLQAAAAEAGVNGEQLAKTIAEFNARVENGEADPLGRTNIPCGIAADTYYIIELKMRTATTLGGLKTNDSMQVLDQNDQPIAGLYAAGEVVGAANGIESMPSCMNGWSLVSARQAAASILEELK